MDKRTYRMYGMVNYQLSGIQKGIQFGHAVVEYGISFGNTKEYKRWSNHDKTFIILNGGTTNLRWFDGKQIGTLNQYRNEIRDKEIPYSDFHEPDLGDQLTSFVFLVDDRVFDRESWPDYSGTFYMDGTPDETEYWDWKMKFSENEKEAERIIWLRDWLPRFKLA